MYILQAVGPFKAGQSITFNPPASNISYDYVHLGIQCPQAPLLSEFSTTDERSAKAVRFKIDTGSGVFYMNPNEILEFADMSQLTCFVVKPLQDVDVYTIIEMQFKEVEES